MSVDIGPFQDITEVGWGGNDMLFMRLQYQNPWRFDPLFTDGLIFFAIRFPDNPELNMGQFEDNQGTLYSQSDNIPAWSGFSMPSQSFLYYLGPKEEIVAGIMFGERLDDGNFDFASFFRVPELPASEGQVRIQVFALASFVRSEDDPIVESVSGTIAFEVARRMEELPVPSAEFTDTQAPFAGQNLSLNWFGGGDRREFLNLWSVPLGSDVLVEHFDPTFSTIFPPGALCETCGSLVAEIVYNRGSRTAEITTF